MNARLAPFALSAILPLFLFSWFVPVGMLQLDLLILWLVAMVLIGLPMLLLEIVLAKRSQKSVWQGMQVLTREADAKLHWRAFGGLSVLIAFVIAGAIVATSGASLATIPQIGVPSLALAFGLMVGALILSLLKGRLLAIGAVIVAVGGIVSLVLGGGGQVAMTPMGLREWAVAMMMTLGSLGLGTGLYWALVGQSQAVAKTALPIWLAQLVFGGLALLVHSFGVADIARLVMAGGAVLVAGFFVYYGASQLIARFGMLVGVGLSVVVCLALSAVPVAVFGWVLIGLALLSALILSIFAGFAMKISHLRKSFGFKSELTYNLWRVAVRLVVPIAILLAWAGWILLGLQ